ncbi:MAG: hypothetical protein ACRDPC_24825 [Solirubrobacteraceae bacterium]
MRIKRPSPSMTVASIALFVSLGGTSIAAVNYARNAGKVDGRHAVSPTSTLSRAAGELVATKRKGADKGRIPNQFLADVPFTESFERRLEVADDQPGAPAALVTSGSLGTLTAQCSDQAARPGVEDPVIQLAWVNGTGVSINVARRVGVGDGAVESLGPGAQAPLRVPAQNTFSYYVQLGTANVLVNGMARQEGRGTGAGTCFVSGALTRID